ncbi:polarity establishment/cellular polarization [Lithohypha guttulata]|nr:polarity establishment/cellular polarization [Lithohypha guttulata]
MQTLWVRAKLERVTLQQRASCLQNVVFAQPQISYPINAQTPPVAVIDQPFSFSFAPGTFSSTQPLSYSLAVSPDWLQLDSDSRTLLGIPSEQDVGHVHITLTASDGEGTAILDADLLVVDQKSILTARDILSDRISEAGEYSAPSTLLLRPQTAFTLAFGPDVFDTDDSSIKYYATSADNSPLPAWVHFDDNAVIFSGTSPSLLTPQSSPQTFSFALAASTILGFSQAVVNFQVSVSNHVLAFLQPTQKFNASVGDEFSTPALLSQLYRDDTPLDRSLIRVTSSNQPDWLMLREDELSFHGIVPDVSDTVFSLSVTDNLNNVAETEIRIYLNDPKADDYPIELYLGMLDVTRGSLLEYSYDLGGKVDPPDDIELDLNLARSWLTFSRNNFTLRGIVPDDADAAVFNITLMIKQDENIKQLDNLTIRIIQGDNPTSTNISETNSGTTTPTATDNGVASSDDETQAPVTRKKALALLVALPILAAALLCLVAFIVVRKSRDRPLETSRHSTSATSNGRASTQDMSHDSSSENIVILAGTSPLSQSSAGVMPSSPPLRVDLPWSLHLKPRNRRHSVNEDDAATTPTTRSSWELLLEDDDHVDSETGSPGGLEMASTSLTGWEHSKRPLTSPRQQRSLSVQRLGYRNFKPESQAMMAKFDGRRRSGLGHGNVLEATPSNHVESALRSVPLSPTSEMQIAQKYGNRRFREPLRLQERSATHGLEKQPRLTTWKTTLKQKVPSSTSTESIYAPPAEEEGSARTESGSSSASRWEDDDWTTGSSEHQSQGRQAREVAGGLSLRVADREKSEVARGPRITSALSQGPSLGSQQSGNSQGISLRFI